MREGQGIRIRGKRKTVVCQITDSLPLQACGAAADQIWKCEQIGPHERHQVGGHTIVHERVGNGYSCRSVEDLIRASGGYLEALGAWHGTRFVSA